MYLYVLGFSKHPSLLKIGVSVSPLNRVATLEAWHGKCTSALFYNIGKAYHRAEKLLHVLLEDSNVRVDGDGGTEFFDASVVLDKVEKVVELCGGSKEDFVIPRSKGLENTRMNLDKKVKVTESNFLDILYDCIFNRPDLVSITTSNDSITITKSSGNYYSSSDVLSISECAGRTVLRGELSSRLLICLSCSNLVNNRWEIVIRSYENLAKYYGVSLEGSSVHKKLIRFYQKVEDFILSM